MKAALCVTGIILLCLAIDSIAKKLPPYFSDLSFQSLIPCIARFVSRPPFVASSRIVGMVSLTIPTNFVCDLEICDWRVIRLRPLGYSLYFTWVHCSMHWLGRRPAAFGCSTMIYGFSPLWSEGQIVLCELQVFFQNFCRGSVPISVLKVDFLT